MALDAKSASSKLKFNVYIVRHGETDHNRLGIIQGQLNTKLSDLGVEQAKTVGQYLKNVKFDYAFSSDLDRAYFVRYDYLYTFFWVHDYYITQTFT
jgi:bisphosphoglycerate-dependent phosphoglycerate mutase